MVSALTQLLWECFVSLYLGMALCPSEESFCGSRASDVDKIDGSLCPAQNSDLGGHFSQSPFWLILVLLWIKTGGCVA